MNNKTDSFLTRIVDELIATVDGNNFADYTVVFPTRRAALLFKLQLAKKLNKAVLLPSVLSISDFVEHYMPLRVAEKKEVLLDLFAVYKPFFPDYDFTSFAPWGEMILGDFEEINLYLVNYKDLFADLTSYHEIESVFQDDDEFKEQLKQFFELFSTDKTSTIKQNFLYAWQALPKLYEKLNEVLYKNNKTTAGKAMQQLALSPETYLKNLDCSKTIIAGFYALAPAEQKLFEYILNGKGKIFWDADEYYTKNTTQEAGLFFRKNFLTQNSFKWQETYFKDIPKNINVTGVPLITGQFKFLADRLKTLIAQNKLNTDKTAIVLPDEKLLPLLLQSLPEEIEHVNITMGFPLKETHLYRFIETLNVLLNQISETSKQKFVSTFALGNYLAHPYASLLKHDIRNLNDAGISIPLNELPENISQFLKSQITSPIFEGYIQLLTMLHDAMEPKHHEKEIAGFVLNELLELRTMVIPYTEILNEQALQMLISEILDTTRIPFSGEPVKGLQVMGLLETRTLDFENIFFLNVNEGSVPKSNRHHSFIPFTIRKSFGLPLLDEQDAITAYHFWRLMQRAYEIDLIYNTEVNEFASGERSRFLLQLFYEMKLHFSNWQVSHQIITTPLYRYNYITPGVKRDEQLTNHLLSMVAENKLRFSASSLNSFIHCSLQYYFKEIKKIREPDDNGEEIDAAVFGKILHDAVSKIYAQIIDVEFDKDNAAQLKKSISAFVKASIAQEYDKHYQGTGYTVIIEKIISEYIERIIAADLKSETFSPHELETEKVVVCDIGNGINVKIKGIFDRIDKVSDGYRIVDYKTGSDVVKNIKKPDELTSEPKYKVNFQLLLYCWLFLKSHSNEKVNAGIYPLRRMEAGIEMLGQQPLTDHSKFEELLFALIRKILLESDFTMTTDTLRCKYCPYKDICNR
ncbi:MAG TPA: PD-(D/E)XK nuclease family protein [Bacteroidia bacterium]|nr:PD-(D/E)XK nuclease family protein [Bacteroidia bacterium]MBP7715420.1 PD-(D/E)XK nuclease family protein [Bacteroidia bacterium]HOZ83124.1 PD-(D/E)XK nuclease family protein [Bacteroidia bacterium]HOZ89926.1 PD-(D/E)XK nuclease family protein [Bacteroidia bacterium]HQW18085.1 PD-(D/E)XK nuclease family protein [Bacteroidia bacterium]